MTSKAIRRLLCVSGLALAASPANAQLLWSEEFNSGSLPDSEVWSYDLGDHGWGNQELQNYTDEPENVRVENGHLAITALDVSPDPANPSFTSGRIRTQDKLTFKYATIEARIKLNSLADGLWPAFWTLGNNYSTVGWPSCGEVDILEMGSSSSIATDMVDRRVSSAAHWERNGNHTFYGRALNADDDLVDEFHVLKMEWTPDSITTYIDNQEIWVIDIDAKSCSDCTEFHNPHFMILNMAVGGTFTGLLDEDEITAPLPAEMQVDYIRIYDNGFTEISGTSIPVPEPVGAEYSGSWYNPQQSGHGFSLEFGSAADGSPLAVAYWYTYDDQGNPIFMLGTGVMEDDRIEITLESPVGMRYGVFDPDEVRRETGGTAVFEFSDPDNATFSYTPSSFSMTNWGHTSIDSLPLVKLFSIPYSNSAQ